MKNKGSWLLLGVAALLLSFPQESSAAAREAITICLDLMIPSLFPFFVLSSLFVATGLAGRLGVLCERAMQPLFHLSGSCAAALVLGAVGGYPVGLRTTAELYKSGQCSQADAVRLSAFCNNCGPAFLLGVSGLGVFSSKQVGFLLIATHLTAALCVGLCLRVLQPAEQRRGRERRTAPVERSLADAFPDCVRDSFSATLNVCSFVIAFSVLMRLIDCSGLLAQAVQGLTLLSHTSPDLCKSFLIGIVELSTGMCSLKPSAALPLALPLGAFLLGWGGLSVHCQSLPFLRECGISARTYLWGKLGQGCVAALLTAVLAPHVIPAEAVLAAHDLVLETPLPQLVRQEILALWGLAGCCFLFALQKRKRLR